MKFLRVFLFSIIILLPKISFGEAYLMLNEVSQGVQDDQEYVEFVVFGVGECGNANFTMDVRGLIFDDTNGDYYAASGINSNISQGALRFSFSSFWQFIPVGTYIVIYNELDRNPLIPPDDLSITDGNNRIILPANSPLLEGSGVSPSISNPDADGPWITGGGQWSFVAMDNAGDSFRLQATSQLPLVTFHDFSWGTNYSPFILPEHYYPGPASGMVFYADIGFGYQGCTYGPAINSQTPGNPNNATNDAYVTQMFNIGDPIEITFQSGQETCPNACNAWAFASVTGGMGNYSYSWSTPVGNNAFATDLCAGSYVVTVTDQNECIGIDTITIAPVEGMEVSMQQTNESCAGECDGSVIAEVAGGANPISVIWSDGSSGLELTGLCPDLYEAEFVDANGCTATVNVTIDPGPAPVNSVFSAAGPFSENDPPVQLQNSVPGGVYETLNCTDCLTSDGVFDPEAAGPGVFEVCYSISNGACSSTQCQFITVNPCTPVQTSETRYVCPGDSSLIFGNWENQSGLYAHTFEGAACDSIHQINLANYSAPDIYLSFDLCEGDSLQFNGFWVNHSAEFTEQLESADGCRYVRIVTITESYCPAESIIYVPNSFTPNGDGINDEFKIELLGGSLENGFIYNRWGEVIATFDANNLSWNGMNSAGFLSPDGVYTYLFHYTTIDGITEQVIGHVTLLR